MTPPDKKMKDAASEASETAEAETKETSETMVYDG